MGQIQHSFRRYEKKFLLTQAQYEAILPQLRGYMLPDEYGAYTICNIYYDTDTFELIRTSLEKPAYKEKFRLRSYGVPDENGRVFAELKKKFQGVVYKRRVEDRPAAITDFVENGRLLNENPQIQREILWFLHCVRPEPKVFIAYDRTAFAGAEEPALRVTFDRNLRYRTERLNLMEGDDGLPVLPDGRIVMEMKAPVSLPLWMVSLLGEHQIYSTSFSKYGTCYQRHLLPGRFPNIMERTSNAPLRGTTRKKGVIYYAEQYFDNTRYPDTSSGVSADSYGDGRGNGSRIPV